jgi:uncharacterized membrane protein
VAGIGFQLSKIGQEHGLGGVANAAIFGAFISSGPWLIMAGAVLVLNRWAAGHLTSQEHIGIQTILVYSFTLSTLIATPVATLATRATADQIYFNDRAAVSSIFLAAMSAATGLAIIAGSIAFGIAISLRPGEFLFALAIVVLLAQIWVASPLLTAVKRIRPIMVGYFAGIAVAAVLIFFFNRLGSVLLLAAIAAGLATTLMLICIAVKDEFPARARWPTQHNEYPSWLVALGLTGLANALALGIDKWILWFGRDSIQTIGSLRINPVNDQSSFLGLLTIVPGLTLMLIVTETRFSRVFDKLLAHCTGTATYRTIEKARQEVAATIIGDARILIMCQTVIAAFCWVLALQIQQFVGGDPRGIFGFRFTVVGVVFHVIALHATVVMSYYDLIPRVLLVWTTFALVSAIATVASMGAGFASFGWGYMVGALAAAMVALTLMAQATSRLTYLLFIGNNPAAVVRKGQFA